MSTNVVVLTGNLGRDAEMRYSADGKAVVKFSVAVSSYYGGKENTDWFDIVAFGDRYEKLTEYLTKGQKLAISGRLKNNTWTDDSGSKRSRVEVIANDIELLSSRLPIVPQGVGGTPGEKKETGDADW